MASSEKILILTQCFPPVIGGIENLMRGMAQAMTNAGKRVIVYADTPADSKGDSTVFYTIVHFGGIKYFRQRNKASSADMLIKCEGIEKIFCDSWKSLEFLKSSTKEITIFAHGTEYPLSPTPKKKERITNTLAKANRILANSEATRNRIICCGINPAKIEIWHPPIDFPLYPPLTEEEKRNANILWGNAGKCLLSVGRLVPRKGMDFAICAIADLVKIYPDLRYIIVGEGFYKKKLENLVIRHQLSEHVHFTGAVSERQKSALYESADLFILPNRQIKSDMEGYGLVFIEAGYYGVPAVSGNTGGAIEAVEDEKTGRHCDGENIQSVRNTIATFLRDENECKYFGKNAKIKATKMLWENKVKELI